MQYNKKYSNFNQKVICIVLIVNIVNAMASGDKIIGGARPTDLKKAEDDLNASLSKLDTGEGPHYKLGKIYSAETQVVAGTLTRIVADLVDADGNTKNCKVTIWNRSWLPNGVEITFEFDGEEKIVKKHNA